LPYPFKAKGKVILFDGFLRLYQTEDKDTESQQTFKVQEGEKVTLRKAEAVQKFTKPPVRYTEASLVRKMEELGIGRPSTYAPTISTIQKRNYVQRKTIPARQVKVKKLIFEDGKITEKTLTEKQGYEKNKLVPTDMGFIVTDFLTGHFSDILDYNFTAQVEEEFDRIARGEEEWKSLIRRFYEQFDPVVEKVEKESKRAKGERLLGVDPETGQKVYVKYGPYGPMVQLGESLQKTKPRYASLLPGMSLMDVTLEEALELLKLPKKIGEIDGEEVVVGMGKFGPYVRYQNKFFNIPPHINPLKITLEDALAVIRRKQGMDKPLAHVDGQPVVLSSGRYGPYLKWKGLNIPIPKGTDPHSLQEEDIRRLIEAKQEKDRQNTLRQWPEGYAIRKGGWGRLYAYAPDGKKKILPKNTDPAQWTLEQVRQLFNKTK
jgi:DNA topoisomerase-1